MRRPLLLIAALALAVPATAPIAVAEVRRCEMSTGQTVYTDRRCDSIGAVERRGGSAQVQIRRYRTSCARTVRDLYFEVSAALESRDVNRLAGIYHWPGMSTRQGYDVMKRLQVIVDRTLVDLQPLYPGDGDWYAPRTRPPYAFRAEQVSAKGSTPLGATFGIRRHLDCWWVTLGASAPAAPSRPAAVPAAEGWVRMPPSPPLAEPVASEPAAGTPAPAPGPATGASPPR